MKFPFVIILALSFWSELSIAQDTVHDALAQESGIEQASAENTVADSAENPENVASVENTKAQEIDDLLSQLVAAKLFQIKPVLEQIEAVSGRESLQLFQLMLEGNLNYIETSLRVVKLQDSTHENQQHAFDVMTGEDLGLVETENIEKIRVNNSIRVHLRSAIARVLLLHGNLEERKQSAFVLLDNINEKNVAVLRFARETEKNIKAKEAINTAIALYELNNAEQAMVRLAAMDTLSGSLEPVVRNAFSNIIRQDDNGNYLEPEAVIRRAAEKELTRIEGKIKFYSFVEQLFFGLSAGSVLLLVAIGLAITFGVMGVINMAHGEMIMLGAYTTYVVQLIMPNYINYSIFVAIPSAFLVSGLVGIIIQFSVIRHLNGRPLETLLATFGISLILQQTVRTIFSPLNRQVSTPDWMSGSLQFNPVFSLTYNRLYILLFAIMVFFLLLFIIKKTSLGLYVRAVSQNRDMAKALGVRTAWVDAMTFGLGSGIAGVAGVALSQITNVGPNLGQAYIIDSFMVVVFGGVGNILGTLFGGFSLGTAQKFLEPATGAVLANILVLVFIILFIQRRPKGLFPQKGRAAE